MTSPMSDYSNDAKEFLDDYTKTTQRDDRLEFHQDIVQDYNDSYNRAYQLLNTFYAESYKDVSYYLGSQWSLEEISYLNNQRRSSFTYNYTRKNINVVLGHQIKNRLSTIVSPIEGSSEETADILSDAIQYAMQYADGYGMLSDAFRGGLIAGISWISPWVDYRDDPVNGDIRYHVDDWNAVAFDPFANLSKKDLSDCSFVARRKFLSRTEVCSLIPDQQEKIMALPWGSRDDKFTYLPYARQWGMQKLLNYNEYWRTKWVNKDVLVDMITGETKEWDGDRKRLELFRQAFPSIEVIRKPTKSVELGIIVEGELLYYGKDPYGLNEYPFVPCTAIFENSYDLWEWKLQSLCRISRDPNTELNKRRSKMIDILDNQLNSGWIAKTNSVSNPTSLYKSGQGQVIFLKPEAQMSDISRLDPAQIPPSMFQMEQLFKDDIPNLMGINPEMFGMSENENIETAGILAKMRQNAGLVNLQPIFESFNQTQKQLGKLTLKLIQKNYSPEKIELITKKKPTAEFYSSSFLKYDIVLEEGILTDTQQQADFAQRLALKSLGVNITDEELIDASNIHDKKTLKDRIAQQSQMQAQAEKMQLEMALQQQATVVNSMDAKAKSDESLAKERIAKIGLDAALNSERIARAEEDRTAGLLNLVKAAKELESMDLTNLVNKMKAIQDFQLHIHNMEQVDKAVTTADAESKASNDQPTETA